ncbi:hypothetical protein AB0B45_18530 [Nonomuraea sp. NPDC049152]|uniref:hypothetical protein n=1 Tax=Nonomuraea sp. NPDC049152 TaxID=3154350 RepID=UPI0033E35602
MTVHDLAAAMPDIPTLRDRCRALAALDAILGGEWACRSYDPAWGPGEEMASMDNGSGDGYSIVFTADGAYVRGFDHESPMSPWAAEPVALWPGLVDQVPEAFRAQVEEPAFTMDGVPSITVCLWRTHDDTRWHAGSIDFPLGEHGDPDGADWLFSLLTGLTAKAYQEWAEDYYETEVPLDAVEHVLALRPLTAEIVAALNADAGMADLEEIGYPA